MQAPELVLSDILALGSAGGYSQSPVLSQSQSALLLSACVPLRDRYLWQTKLMPIPDDEYELILELIEQTEAALMQSRVGVIFHTINDIAGDGVLLLDGQSVLVVDYPELADVVPASWITGGNINLPDARDAGLRSDQSQAIGTIFGSNTITLNESQIPAHTHTQQAHAHTVTVPVLTPTAAGEIPAAASVQSGAIGVSTSATVAVNNDTGGGESHGNIPESLSVYTWIVTR